MADTGLDLPLTPEASAGLRPSAIESLSLMIESFAMGSDWEPVLPPALVAQIQYVARQDVPMEKVMRGVGIVGSVFMEALFGGLDEHEAQAAMKYIAAWQIQNQDKVLAAFADVYTAEQERLGLSPTHKLSKEVKLLLEGRSGNASAIEYKLDLCHIGLVAIGERADLFARRLAETLGAAILTAPDAESTFWIWLGASRRLEFGDLERAATGVADSIAIGAGEPREGLAGWRLTHREAASAAPVAQLEGLGLVRYSNVALLAGALYDQAMGRALVDRYLEPLERHRDAEDLRRTLRTYFDLSCNAVSTASTLEVNRHTVQRRLKRVEEAIGEPPSTRQAEFQVALRLERLTALQLSANGS